MDVIATWPGRILVFFLAFPLVMFGIPFIVASLRQKLTWNKRRPSDADTHPGAEAGAP